MLFSSQDSSVEKVIGQIGIFILYDVVNGMVGVWWFVGYTDLSD